MAPARGMQEKRGVDRVLAVLGEESSEGSARTLRLAVNRGTWRRGDTKDSQTVSHNMTSDNQAFESAGATDGESAQLQAPSWLLRQRITVPDRVAGYVERAGLLDRSMPTQRRLTVLKASGGFGKTTLLAECCRSLREQGVPAAWVSLDELDEPEVLDTYIAFACHAAGLDLLDVSGAEEAGGELGSRLGLVVRRIQSFASPFLIAFDELERLENPACVALLEYLLQRGPLNLHLAVACRRIPDGLNVAGVVLEGRARILGSQDLRFSRADVARFFDLALPRRELAEEIERSAGWPLALRIARNRIEGGVQAAAGVLQDFVRNWIETRLFVDLGREEREFLLDLGLFDWIDAALLDEVLQRSNSVQRLQSMGVLAGLLEPVSDGLSTTWRLHPLVREHCVRQRFQETPERFRAIHCRLAEVLARRGETVQAMRHAVEGGEPLLAGDILERAGGVRLWTRQGAGQLRAAHGLLSNEVVSARPRLALVRCIALALSGRLEEARALYKEVSATHAPRRGDGGARGFDYSVDECIVRAGLALYGGELGTSKLIRTLAGDIERLARSPRMDPQTRGHLEYARSGLHHLKAEFDAALERLAAARECLAGSPYIALHGELLHGQVELARGRVEEAESRYRRALRIARKNVVVDPVPAAGSDAALKELALECNRVSNRAQSFGVSNGFDGLRRALLLSRHRQRRGDRMASAGPATRPGTRHRGRTACVRALGRADLAGPVRGGDARFSARERRAARRRRARLAARQAAGGFRRLRGSDRADVAGNGGSLVRAPALVDRGPAVRGGPRPGPGVGRGGLGPAPEANADAGPCAVGDACRSVPGGRNRPYRS